MENCMDRYLGQMLDNRYEILEVIGSGGMAIVYKALCHRLNRYVAVKILKDEYAEDEEFREHFKAESQAVAMLSHPNIVAVYDYSKDPHCQYIVMELLEGITLKQYMQKKGALSWKEALHFVTQIGKALSHAHSKGIIHRDIKPQNIMVVKDGSIKVADFGIAYLQNEDFSEAPETMGSIHYISPEQARGETADARADIYSLGVVMYEMLTGQLPYDGDTVESIAFQHINQLLTLPGDINPDIPIALENITLKAMSSDINSRYQSADELLYDLEAFRKSQAYSDYNGVEELSPVADDTSPPISRKTPRKLLDDDYKSKKKRSRKVSTFSGIALIAIFLLAVLALLWKFSLSDMFTSAQRVEIPNFVGGNSEDIVHSKAYSGTYNFDVVYSDSSTQAKGTIIKQDPESGRSIALTKGGIDITLTVSTGVLKTAMPDMVNHEYREAKASLEKIGLKVKEEDFPSDSVTVGYVVKTAPVANEQITSDNTVTLYVSSGPSTGTVTMPNLVGKSKAAAVSALSDLKLKVGSISESESAYVAGTVLWQNINAGENISVGTIVYLRVSAGQKTNIPSSSPSSSGTSSEETSGETNNSSASNSENNG